MLNGNYTTPTIQLTGEYRIRWQESKPLDTNIVIECTTGQTQGQWQKVNNGDVIDADTNLWIRATLSTVDNIITPILQDLWLEEPDEPQDKISITMDWWGKFNNVVGDLTVAYDASKGSLSGRGGAVESFTREFLPTELVATPNPNAEENISVAPFEIVAELKDIEYPKGYSEQGNISVAPFEVTATLINVEDINP